MNINEIKEATKEQIESNLTLYSRVIDLLTYCNHKAPAGSCCGRNKKKIIDHFFANKEKYIQQASASLERKIQPKWRGTLYFSRANQQISADYITDSEILKLVQNNLVEEKYFDFSKYYEENKPDEEVKPDETEVTPSTNSQSSNGQSEGKNYKKNKRK